MVIEYIENVMSKEDCDTLISYLINSDQPAPELTKNSLKRTKAKHHSIVLNIINKFNINCDRAFIMHYPKGVGSVWHVDNHSVENGDDIYYKWKTSSIIFLNDNFDGGELVYPDQDITIKPKTGMMVIAPADDKFPHFVNPSSSDRYVLVTRNN